MFPDTEPATKILLIQCYGALQPINAEPLSVETLAGALRQTFHGQVSVEIAILDEQIDPEGEQLAGRIAADGCVDIIGMSVPQSTYFLALNFLHKLKALNVSP